MKSLIAVGYSDEQFNRFHAFAVTAKYIFNSFSFSHWAKVETRIDYKW